MTDVLRALQQKVFYNISYAPPTQGPKNYKLSLLYPPEKTMLTRYP